MSKQVKSVAKGISVLGIAGIICKVVGVLFSIPLNMISTEVATIFYLVYPTYTLLLTISSAGLPVAVSRMVAGFLAKDDPRNALTYCMELANRGIPYAIHTFEDGPHGAALYDGKDPDSPYFPHTVMWAEIAADWLKNRGF